MYDMPLKITAQSNATQGAGAMLVTFAGLASAFAVASTYALPLLLTALGIGTAWIEGVGCMAAPHRTMLLSIGLLSLAAGAVMLWFQQQAVHESYDSRLEASPAIRTITFLGLVLGAILLAAGNSCV